jgi:hypothetical protein
MPRVLIGSSTEGLPLARAIQEQLELDCWPRLWTDNVFNLSRTAIESLLDKLDDADFAILVVTPDDMQTTRQQEVVVGRDNVLFEFGLAIGRLGRERAFLVTPRDVPDLHLPTDLLGLVPTQYFWTHGDDDWLAVLGPAANRIRRALRTEGRRSRAPIDESGYFGQFSSQFATLIGRAREITLYFIHSRRWRESHLSHVEQALSGQCEKLDVYLPDMTNSLLRNSLAAHFDDGPFIAGLTLEGYDYWRRLQEKYPNRVNVRLFDWYPTYSFYRFDNDVIVAMYPNTARKKEVPAFRITTDSPYWEFISDDLDQVRHKNPLTAAQLADLVARRVPDHGNHG